MIWKSVWGGKYQVSENGDIIPTHARVAAKQGCVLRQATKSRSEYKQVTLCSDTERKSILVHRLVAETFFGPAPKCLVVNHKNGNKADNRVQNLEYITQHANERHAIENGLKARGQRHGMSRITDRDAGRIKQMLRTGTNRKIIARVIGCSLATVHLIAQRRTWAHIP